MKRVKYILITVLVALSIFSLVACTKKDKGTIVTTTSVLADLVSNIAGDGEKVSPLMGANVDAHHFQMTSSHTSKIKNAKAVFTMGLQLEGKALDSIKNIAKNKNKVFSVGDELYQTLKVSKKGFIKAGEHEHHHEGEHEHEHEEHHHHGEIDPHFWHDINLWKEAAKIVEKKLSEIDKKNTAKYKKNLNSYLEKLSNLDKELKEKLSKIPEEKKRVVTQHDAFAYLERAFGIEFLHIQGVSTIAEANERDLTELVGEIKEHNVRAIFSESSLSDKGINALIDLAKKSGHELKKGGVLFADALGTKDENADTYIKMMTRNINTIVSAIQ